MILPVLLKACANFETTARVSITGVVLFVDRRQQERIQK